MESEMEISTLISSKPLSITLQSRVLRSPLSDDQIWKRLRDAGFDEESIKHKDKSALVAYIAKLENEHKLEFVGLFEEIVLQKPEFEPPMFSLYDSGDSDEKIYAPFSRDILHPVISDRKDSFLGRLSRLIILEFILVSALKFSNYGKLMILSLLKGVGYAIMHPNIAPVLSRSIEQYYDDRCKSRQKISNTRTKIMCLLLEEDSFRALVFLCRSANGDVQSATKEALMRITTACDDVSNSLRVTGIMFNT